MEQNVNHINNSDYIIPIKEYAVTSNSQTIGHVVFHQSLHVGHGQRIFCQLLYACKNPEPVISWIVAQMSERSVGELNVIRVSVLSHLSIYQGNVDLRWCGHMIP